VCEPDTPIIYSIWFIQLAESPFLYFLKNISEGFLVLNDGARHKLKDRGYLISGYRGTFYPPSPLVEKLGKVAFCFFQIQSNI